MNVFSDLKLNNKTSVYLQIIQHVKRKILNKSIIAYTPLPSRRELASLLSINPNTVQKAYQLLERDGIIYSVPGKGSFIAEAANALSQQREQAVEKLRDAAGRALDCGLSLEEAQNCVKEVYEGGRPAVNQQEGSDGHD